MTPLATVRQPDSPSPAVRRYADGRNGAIRPLGLLPTCPDCGRTNTDRIYRGGAYVWGHICESAGDDAA